MNKKQIKQYVQRIDRFTQEWYGALGISVLISAFISFMSALGHSFEDHSMFHFILIVIGAFFCMIFLTVLLSYGIWEGWNLVKYIRDWSYSPDPEA